MKQLLLSIVLTQLSLICFSQKQVQQLAPVRIAIFKNGNYFLKRTGKVQLIDRTFTLPAPTDALMGSFWLSVGKDIEVESIAMRLDTMRVEKPTVTMDDYLAANINRQISVAKTSLPPSGLTGLLLGFDKQSRLIKIRNLNGSIAIAKADDFDQLQMPADANQFVSRDSIVPLARVRINKPEATVSATTVSLHPGLHWYASYLFTTISDKEASLSMKATLVNDQEFDVSTNLDIIIGSPEMFYNSQLDPACALFLSRHFLTSAKSYSVSTQLNSNGVQANRFMGDADPGSGTNSGNKMEDLYMYNLGIHELPANSALIIPIVTSKITFEDIYTVDFTTNVREMEPVFHKYRMMNSTGAPLTTGSVLVVNRQEVPVAQSQLYYTPVRNYQDINLSKALDVPVKNAEAIVKTEKTLIRDDDDGFYDKITYKGAIDIQNFQDKKIKMFVTKTLAGKLIEASQGAKNNLLRGNSDDTNKFNRVEWEIEIAPGSKQQLTYTYTSLE